MSSAVAKIREYCMIISKDPDLRNDPYTLGYINGMLEMAGLEWRDLCGECEGCEAPICPPKKLKVLG